VGDIVRVSDPELEVDATDGLSGHIRDDVSPDLAIRDDQGLVVDGQDRGRHEAHLAHLPEDASCAIDHVPHVVGSIDEDHHAGRKVSERVLERESNHKAGDPEPGQHGADLDSQLREGDQEADGEYGSRAQRYEHALQEL